MKHILLEQLDEGLNQQIETLDNCQALALAGLSISRLWYPFEKWSLQHQAPRLAQWAKQCMDILWEQIILEQTYGLNFAGYDKNLDKIDRKLERLEDNDISVDGSSASPLLDAFACALCCFYDPKFLPGLNPISFERDITAIVGQGAEYIYDVLFSNSDKEDEEDIITLVSQSPAWQGELLRIKEDIALVKSFPQNKQDVLRQREAYELLDIFRGI